jgi:hypothetical protein
VYFVFGAFIGVLAGLVVGLEAAEGFRPIVFWLASGGGLVFGLLALVLKEDITELFP